MYEKHESYGVLKLSKQALQKGTVLNCAPLYSENDWNCSTQFETGSKRFRTSRKLGRYFQHIIMAHNLWVSTGQLTNGTLEG